MEIRPKAFFINGKVIVDNGSGQWKVVVSNCRNGYKYSDLNDACLAQYKMNDYAASTTVSDSQGTQDGTLTVNTVTISEAGYTGANGDYCLHFGGTDYINCQDIAAWDNLRAFACWYKADAFAIEGGAGQTLLAHDVSADNDKRISFTTGGRIFVVHRFNAADYDNYGTNVAGEGVLSAGEWYHIAVNFLADGVQIFVDGVDVTSADASGAGHASTTSLLIGAFSTGAGRADGTFDNVCLFDRILTACEINTLYNSNNGTEKLVGCCCFGSEINLSTNLVAHWKFNEKTGTVIYDDSGNGLNGVLSADASNTTSTEAIRGTSHYFNATYYAMVDDTSTLSFGTGAMSISAWIRCDVADAMSIVGKYDATLVQCEYAFYVEGGALKIYLTNLSETQTLAAYTANSVLATGSWYHVAFTYDGTDNPTDTNLKLYINGVDTAKTIERTSFVGMANGTAKIGLGAWQANGVVDASSIFDGYLDNIAMWNKMLSSCEVEVLYGHGRGTEDMVEGCCPSSSSSSSSSAASSSSSSSSSSKSSSSSSSSKSSSSSSSSKSSSSSSSSKSSSSSSSSKSSSSSAPPVISSSHTHPGQGSPGFLIHKYSEEEITDLRNRFGDKLDTMTNAQKEDFLIDLVSNSVITADQALALAIREGLTNDS